MNAIVKPEADTAVSPAVTHKNVFAALAAAQAEMGKAIKESSNPAFRSKYADLGNVMDACLPALNSHGIALLQPPCEIDGARYVKTILAHESGETLECAVPLIIGKNDMQGYGSAVTYARRYGLMAMAGIAPEDDDGTAAVVAAPRQEQRRDPVRQEPQRQQGPSAIDTACDSLARADTLDRLAAIWGDLPRSVQGEQRVIAAKDAAKSRLAKPAADLGGGDTPY